MPQQEAYIDWEMVMRRAGPYPLEAFDFIREGLHFTTLRIHKDYEHLPELERHVSGQQLCLGLRDFAIRKYGLMARAVMDHWKIERTDDFGRIVFAMIDAGLMSHTDEDDFEDFRSVYDFDEAFSREALLDRISAG